VVTSDPPRPGHRSLGDDAQDSLVRIGQRVPPAAATGEFVGLAAFSPRGVEAMREAYRQALATGGGRVHEAESLGQAAFTDLLQILVEGDHRVTCVSTWKGWLEIDTFEDYQRAWAEIRA
jgi:phosphoenolpyruvate phosphomutase